MESDQIKKKTALSVLFSTRTYKYGIARGLFTLLTQLRTLRSFRKSSHLDTSTKNGNGYPIAMHTNIAYICFILLIQTYVHTGATNN